jgi:hypothetical protein
MAHISDIVRLRAVVHRGGYVVDLDNIFLRRPPFSTAFTTLWAKKTGGVAPTLPHSKRWCRNRDDTLWDGRGHINFPFSLNLTTHAELANTINAMVTTVIAQIHGGSAFQTPRPSCDEWNIFMWALRDIVLADVSMDRFVWSPLYFGAVPFWRGQAKKLLVGGFYESTDDARTQFGVCLPTSAQILSLSYCVPTSFALHELNLEELDVVQHARRNPTTLLAKLIQHVLLMYSTTGS